MNKRYKTLDDAFDDLPDHYYDTFSDGFLGVLGALRFHGFSVHRADESAPFVDGTDLWGELGHPSVWFYTSEARTITQKLKQSTPGSQEHTNLTNQEIRANLEAQQHLLTLLEGFYNQHTPSSFSARLIVETIDLGESLLRNQGGSVRVVLDKKTQEHQAKEYMAEFMTFGEFLTSHKPDMF